MDFGRIPDQLRDDIVGGLTDTFFGEPDQL
jgi:hypothetical protein